MTWESIDIGNDIEGSGVRGPVKPILVNNIAGVGRVQPMCLVDSAGNVVDTFAGPGLVTYTHTRVVVTQHAVNDTQILKANAARKFGYIINRSAYLVNLAYGETAVLGEGAYVYQTTGRFDINTTQEIRGIQNGGACTLDVYEGV